MQGREELVLNAWAALRDQAPHAVAEEALALARTAYLFGAYLAPAVAVVAPASASEEIAFLAVYEDRVELLNKDKETLVELTYKCLKTFGALGGAAGARFWGGRTAFPLFPTPASRRFPHAVQDGQRR